MATGVVVCHNHGRRASSHTCSASVRFDRVSPSSSVCGVACLHRSKTVVVLVTVKSSLTQEEKSSRCFGCDNLVLNKGRWLCYSPAKLKMRNVFERSGLPEDRFPVLMKCAHRIPGFRGDAAYVAALPTAKKDSRNSKA